MKRISKPPEIRKQELIDIALNLFIEKGYEVVSVRDILKVVNGHPGMFYYYFSSKQDIYEEAMLQLMNKELDERTKILCDKSKAVSIRLKELINQIINSINKFNKMFENKDSNAHQLKVLLDFMTALADPISNLLLELKEEGIIPPETGINEETSYPMALFLIHGCFGVVNVNVSNDRLKRAQYLKPFIANTLNIPIEKLM